VGLVTLHPTETYVVSNPVKLYEYMAAGMPVVASDFPMWRDIVTTADCGLLVDPLNSTEIARAITWLLEHPQEAEAMGKRGREAVLERFNWQPEGNRLVDFVSHFIATNPRCSSGAQRIAETLSAA
jgi:glycosyltransferase involved in cell wall biosynthesis